ncbi:hypothetical protein NIE88_07330 [Sporolactobacillus shoreicorticis]|uniref:RDD domain-containing protein n=1 Tax=Sporolactobacillus shoreicorticis TaxID=1923877 RepID=A0ABW5SAC0_9BACL|nr:hypothetical protein [Sporolactobacillus shoreicorticis]MCO7125581.1 hypothetical protein [Sporolactobacillus shoreicorticis]
MILAGLIIFSFGTYLYISARFGAGPRDGLMVVPARKTGQLVRTVNEGAAFVFGWLLGGSVGIGTVIMLLLIGVFAQSVFKLCRFDVKVVRHVYLDRQMVARILTKSKSQNGGNDRHGL